MRCRFRDSRTEDLEFCNQSFRQPKPALRQVVIASAFTSAIDACIKGVASCRRAAWSVAASPIPARPVYYCRSLPAVIVTPLMTPKIAPNIPPMTIPADPPANAAMRK
jgi:hypothetical protein